MGLNIAAQGGEGAALVCLLLVDGERGEVRRARRHSYERLLVLHARVQRPLLPQSQLSLLVDHHLLPIFVPDKFNGSLTPKRGTYMTVGLLERLRIAQSLNYNSLF